MMAALYPSMAAPEDFKPGDCVRKFVTEWNVTPFVGVVTHVVPATYKVWVQWPIEQTAESPETLIKVNPQIYGLPTVIHDMGYSSYEKDLSDKRYGIPRQASNQEKMAIRIAHTFATDVVGRLVDDIVECKNQELNDVQAYNRVYEKYATICSDYIMQSSIKRIYAEIAPPSGVQQAIDRKKLVPEITDLLHTAGIDQYEMMKITNDLLAIGDDHGKFQTVLPELRGKVKNPAAFKQLWDGLKKLNVIKNEYPVRES